MTQADEMPGAGPPSQAAAPSAAAAMAGAHIVQLEVPDLDGGLRAKLVSAAKAASPSGAAMCTIMFGLTLADDVYDSPTASAGNGYPDLVMRPDLTTLRPLPWARATVAVLCDLFGADGAPFPLAPRTLLRTVTDRCAGLGFEARFAAEWELCIVHRDDELQAGGRHGELTPLGRTMNAYSSLRLR
jgi:glutamine synthetase